jgi:hypothetical protein
MSSEITPLSGGKLVILSNSYELDGRVSTHPVDARGYAPMQTNLLRQGDRALLLGTGLSGHEQRVIAQLEETIGSARLSIMPLGFDFTLLSNARSIADRFGLEYVYQPSYQDLPWTWLNLRPEFPIDETDALRTAAVQIMKTGVPVELGADGERTLHLIVPPIRLLPNPWLYDEATRTMFCVDLFTWVWRSEDRGPWVITEADEDPTTVETVRHALYGNRYWWLSGADTDRLRRALADTFERYEIETLAPDHGCALAGSGVVERHYQLLDELLAEAPDDPPIGVEVGTWTFAEAR